MKTVKLVDLAKTIRSKNAGVDKITFDIIFREKEDYELVKNSGVISKENIAKLYGIDESRISDFVAFDPACAIKFTIYRTRPSGSPGNGDIFGGRPKVCRKAGGLRALQVCGRKAGFADRPGAV